MPLPIYVVRYEHNDPNPPINKGKTSDFKSLTLGKALKFAKSRAAGTAVVYEVVGENWKSVWDGITDR